MTMSPDELFNLNDISVPSAQSQNNMTSAQKCLRNFVNATRLQDEKTYLASADIVHVYKFHLLTFTYFE